VVGKLWAFTIAENFASRLAHMPGTQEGMHQKARGGLEQAHGAEVLRHNFAVIAQRVEAAATMKAERRAQMFRVRFGKFGTPFANIAEQRTSLWLAWRIAWLT
jgi:hypothetical protein